MKPRPERSRGLLKDRASQRVDVIPAELASVGSASSNAVMLAFLLALLAVRNAIRPAHLLDVLKASVIGGKLVIEVPDAITLLGWNGLPLLLHGKESMP